MESHFSTATRTGTRCNRVWSVGFSSFRATRVAAHPEKLKEVNVKFNVKTPPFARRGLAARFSHAVLGALIAIVACNPILAAQEPPSTDQQTIRMLLDRIERLELKVAQLEAGKANVPPPNAASNVEVATAVTAAQTPEPARSEPESSSDHTELEGMERMDMSKTLLRIRGFGDVTFHGDTQQGDSSAFSLGQLDLFITSDISDKFKFIGELVFEAQQRNVFEADLERYILQYSQSDYFNLSLGRYHSAIGYYNTAYHHSTWLQTATERPFLFNFEDEGGILPIHNVGASATGLIPSGRLGLHYVAEIGNGRASRRPLIDEPVQNVVDENNLKAFNLAAFIRPEAVPGLQIGFSGYHDTLTPVAGPRIGESIFDAYAVISRSNFEWLNEALLIRHAPQGESRVFNTPGFYTQFSRRFGSYRPYFRYQYVNAPDNEPVFPDVGLRTGPSVGLRYDLSEFVALKLQYDYTALRRQDAINALTLQVGFTF